MTTLSPALICLPPQLDVAGRGAAEVVHRRGPAQELLHRRSGSARVAPAACAAGPGAAIRASIDVADGVPGGLVARRSRAAGSSCRSRSRVSGSPSSGIRLTSMLIRSVPSPPRALGARACGRTRTPRVRPASGTAGACTASLSGSVEQVRRCSPDRCCRSSGCPSRSAARCRRRHVEQPGQHLDREVGADLLDEVELALCKAVSTVVLVSPRRNSSYLRVSAALGELALDQLAQRPVPRPVGLQHRAAQIASDRRRPPRG